MEQYDLTSFATMDLILMRKHLKDSKFVEEQEMFGAVDNEFKKRIKVKP